MATRNNNEEMGDINPSLATCGASQLTGTPGLFEGNGKPAPWLLANLAKLEEGAERNSLTIQAMVAMVKAMGSRYDPPKPRIVPSRKRWED